MLIKYCDIAGADSTPAIKKIVTGEKYPGGRDASREGAFCVTDKLELTACVPRRLGASGVVLRIAPDGGSDGDIPLELCRTDGGVDCYSVTLQPCELCGDERTGLFYYELLFLRGSRTLFTDTSNNVDFRLSESSGNRFLLLVYSDDFTTPTWFGRNILYHIFADRFSKGSGEFSIRDGSVINEDWENGIPQYAEKAGGEVANNVFFGGNLWGVAEKLDYLVSLGVGTIYLSPVFDAASNHRYDTGDYTSIDQLLGGEEAFDYLLARAGEKGIRVILDGVFNHTGDDSRYFNRYGTYPDTGAYQSMSSEYFRWYSFKDYPDSYECWWNVKIMPRLRLENDECRRYFTARDGIGASYVRRGISGWRLDVADELCDSFLDEFRQSVKEASGGEAIIIGEVWENAADKIAYGKRRRYLRGHQLDSVMNYPVRNGIVEFILHGDGDLLYDILTEIYASYPRCVCDSLMNLLGTHDTERILTVLADAGTDMMSNDELAVFRLSEDARDTAVKRLMLASVIQYTVYGTPSLYYGDEAGVEGGRDPFCRMPYPWGHENTKLLEHYRLLGRIRGEEQVYCGGDFAVLEHGDGYFSFERSSGGNRIITAVNSSNANQVFHMSGIHKNLLNGELIDGNVILKPLEAAVLKLWRSVDLP